MLALQVAGTHLYPGCRAVLEGEDQAGAGSALRPVTLIFSDGAMAAGRLGDNSLEVDAYATAAGTDIPAKAWLVQQDGPNLRVTARRG